MKLPALLITTASICFAAGLPTQDELQAYLAQAKVAWGISVSPVEFRVEPIEPCNIGHGHPVIARTQSYDTITTMHFEDGSPDVVSHNVTYVIRINSNCDWSRLNLRNTVIHEYGHVLCGDGYHSKDKHSVMYYVVESNGKQEILPDDIRHATEQRARS